MKPPKAKDFVKLGTAVRYLMDVKYKMGLGANQPEPLGGSHVLENIETVLRLTDDLGFTGTVESGSFGKLKKMYDRLKVEQESRTDLDATAAMELHLIAAKVRESLLSVGEDHAVASGWPQDFTLDLWMHRTPGRIWAALFAVVIFVGGFGVTIGQSQWFAAAQRSLAPAERAVFTPDPMSGQPILDQGGGEAASPAPSDDATTSARGSQ
jgi:hypothetical protein